MWVILYEEKKRKADRRRCSMVDCVSKGWTSAIDSNERRAITVTPTLTEPCTKSILRGGVKSVKIVNKIWNGTTVSWLSVILLFCKISWNLIIIKNIYIFIYAAVKWLLGIKDPNWLCQPRQTGSPAPFKTNSFTPLIYFWMCFFIDLCNKCKPAVCLPGRKTHWG